MEKKKLSSRSCRDSNLQPFDQESGVITNRLFRLPKNKNYQTISVCWMLSHSVIVFLTLDFMCCTHIFRLEEMIDLIWFDLIDVHVTTLVYLPISCHLHKLCSPCDPPPLTT